MSDLGRVSVLMGTEVVEEANFEEFSSYPTDLTALVHATGLCALSWLHYSSALVPTWSTGTDCACAFDELRQ